MKTTDEQIKTVEQMRDNYLKSQSDAIGEALERVSVETRDKLLTWSDEQKPKIDALTAILEELRESRELLEAGQHFKFGDHSIRIDHHGRFRLARVSSGREIGIFDSALDAFAEVKKQK
jgi:hypothetical protein